MENTLTKGTVLQGKAYRYVIERVLGQGTFGITYLATTQVKVAGALGELETTMQVAVKEFFMKDINGREENTVTTGSKGGLYANYKAKFAREAENLSRLKHPHIVKVLEYFEANNTVYYVMEYVEGGSLEARIKEKGRLPEGECLDCVGQIAFAVSYMHAHKMLHLDLKPGNVMLRKDRTAVLIDFGLSKQYDEDGMPETSTSVGSGTPGYAPLEQANYHEGKDFPVTMDVYALGATLFKMLTGERPPEASIVLNEGFPAHELQRCGVSGEVIACIAKAMAPLKAERYQSVAAFVDGLRHEEEKTVLDGNEEEKAVAGKKKETEKVVEVKVSEGSKDNLFKISERNILVAGGVVILFLLLIMPWSTWRDVGLEEECPLDSVLMEDVLWDSLAPADTLGVATDTACAEVDTMTEDAWMMQLIKEGRQRKEEMEGQWWVKVQFNKGEKYYQEGNYTEAVKWYRKPADQGYAIAQYRLGLCYANGWGVGKDRVEAVKWWRKSAEQGYADAQLKMGICYYDGNGVANNYAEAVKWFRKAAEQGSIYAQFRLGWCYADGLGVVKDENEAVKWYRKAADQGVYDAVKELEKRGLSK